MAQSLGLDLYGFGANYLTKIWMLQRTYNWQLLMSHDINGILGYWVSQYCQEIRFGDYSIADISVLNYGAEQRFYAGLQSINTIMLTFLKPIDNSVLTYFYGWSGLMIDKDGYYYPKNHYKKDIFVVLYNKMGLQSTKFKLKGCFVRKRPCMYSLSYQGEDVLKVDVELCVDNIEIEKGMLSELISKTEQGLLSSVVTPGKGTLETLL